MPRSLLTLLLLVFTAESARAQLPLSAPYVEPGGCPFECCQYGTWVARQAVWAFRDERNPTWTAFLILRGDTVQAVTGDVFSDTLGLVAVRDSLRVEAYQDTAPIMVLLAPGDTLSILTYYGEDVWGFQRGSFRFEASSFWPWPVDVPHPDASVQLLRPLVYDWWVRVRRPDGQEGWLWMRDVPFDGADACG